MAESTFDDIKSFVGFDADDASNVAALRPTVEPFFPVVVERFYAGIRAYPQTPTVFSGGAEHVRRQYEVLAEWLREVFGGVYDQAHCETTVRIGRSHFRHELPQHYMITGVEVIWQELERVVRACDVPDVDEKLRSLRKLLTLKLAVMLDTYKEWYGAQVREEEHTIVEERLTRAEHLAEIGQLAASLAHEIKNPLAGISGAIQIIRDGLGHDDAQHMIISEILAQIKRLDETVKDLLLYARPTPPQRTVFPLDQAVARVLKVLREEPSLQQVTVEFERGCDGAVVQADMRQIEQLIINLLINAAHASGDGGCIQLTIGQTDNSVTLVVKDNGKGMPPEVQKRAFEPFFTTKAKGTGLGLSICKRIAEVHDGDIRLESHIGRGTTVIVELPSIPRKNVQGSHA